MLSSIKSLKVTYKPINLKNTFTNGDWVSGQIILEVTKDCHPDYMSVEFQGKADVKWSERYGYVTETYYSTVKYFGFKHYFIRAGSHTGDDTEPLLTKQNGEAYSSVIAPGRHVYPFTFQIPFKNMPSSFTGSVGKIVYSLEARLSRSLWFDKTDSTVIYFVSRADLNSVPGMMAPQRQCKDKKMNVFTSGSVAMVVNIERTGFLQGEGLKVVTLITNDSSREVTPKYCVYRKRKFFAKGQRQVEKKTLFTEVGQPIAPSARKKVTKILTIPHNVEPSILFCQIIKVEHKLKVYLDIKYSLDLAVKFPIIILLAPQAPAVAPPPAAAAAAADKKPPKKPKPTSSGQRTPHPPPAAAAAPPPIDPPPPYEAHGMYPPLTDFGNRNQ